MVRVPLPGGPVLLAVTKQFILGEAWEGLTCRVTLRLDADRELGYVLRVPFAVSAPPSCCAQALAFPELGIWTLSTQTRGEVTGVRELILEAPAPSGLEISLSRPMTVMYHPLTTDLLLEGQRASLHQGVVLAFHATLGFERNHDVELVWQFRPRPGGDHA